MPGNTYNKRELRREEKLQGGVAMREMPTGMFRDGDRG